MKSVEMKNIIIGTAGHIDHGKTALVRALTGSIRTASKKKSSVAFQLTWASRTWSSPSNLRLGLVDVPGHERFIKNMLAGVSGIDLVLLVIAADESIKPQTREHFDICMLLGIRNGIVVLTKSDLADRGLLELVRLEADEFVRGSFLEAAPVVAVSSTTGAGLDDLRAELAKLAAPVPEKDASEYFRLPIDRAFAMRGFGTVVTGTLVSGTVRVDQEVELHPAANASASAASRCTARRSNGQRRPTHCSERRGRGCLRNARGMVLAETGPVPATTRIDCAFELLLPQNR